MCSLVYVADYQTPQLDSSPKGNVLSELMFDNNKLELSRAYFSMLQMLRIGRQSIERSINGLKTNRVEWQRYKIVWKARYGFTTEEMASVEKNWDAVVSMIETRGGLHLDTINRMVDDVSGLRDGV